MAGIKSYGAYIPYHRLSRSEFAKAWGGIGLPGERAVASADEDSLTMAVEAAFDCTKGMDGAKLDGLFFATTTSPYKEKQCSTIIASVLDMDKEIRTGDFTTSLRSGTTALRAALDAVRAGPAKNIVVTAADCRIGFPYSTQEQSYGDGAASLLVGDSDIIAEVEDCYSVSDELTDVWRRDSDQFVREWEDRWVIMHGYSKNVSQAVSTIMKRNNLSAKDLAKAVIYGPDPRSHGGLMRRLGFDPQTQVQDTFFNAVGNTGSASALMMLVAALEEAKPGDRLIFSSYGDGADAFLLRVTEQIEKVRDRRGAKTHLASKAMLPSYGKYLVARNLVELPPAAGLRGMGSATVMWRTKNWVLSCHASKCRKCGLVTYPPQRVCYGCQSKDEFDEVNLSREQGKLFTYSLDNLAATGINPPVIQSVVEFEGGARFYCMMTDADPQAVEVNMPLEMTFRKIHEFANFHNYFWKCRPPREIPAEGGK